MKTQYITGQQATQILNGGHVMSRIGFCVLTVFLLAATTTGCGNSTPTDSAGVQPDESTGDGSTVEDHSQPTEDTVDSQPKPEIAESTDMPAAVSATLKQALVDLMKERQPDTDPDAVRSQVEDAIVQIRKDVPEFLVVSTETEEKLQAGIPVPHAAKRIADAEAFLNNYVGQLSGVVQWLLPRHKAGNLDAVRTELLAQLIVADMKKAQDALSN